MSGRGGLLFLLLPPWLCWLPLCPRRGRVSEQPLRLRYLHRPRGLLHLHLPAWLWRLPLRAGPARLQSQVGGASPGRQGPWHRMGSGTRGAGAGSPRLDTHFRTLMPDGNVSGKGQDICWEVTLDTLVPVGARPGQGGASTWLPHSPEAPGILGLRDMTGLGLWGTSASPWGRGLVTSARRGPGVGRGL